MSELHALWWLLILLGPLIFIQRRLHWEIQAAFLLLTGRVDLSNVLFALLFLPGILLHEVSHYLMAKILRVPTKKFSVIPQTLADGRLRLGYVETAKTDLLRETLIGAAPLLSGILLIAYVGMIQFGFTDIWRSFQASAQIPAQIDLSPVFSQPDFWLWLYLVTVVSSTMMPSPSDRRSWLPFIGVGLFLLAMGILVGGGPWMLKNIAPQLNVAFSIVALTFAISLMVHIFMWPIWFGLRVILSKLTKRDLG